MSQTAAKKHSIFEPIRRACLRGLAVILPPLLTIIVFIWAWSMIDSYILIPCEHAAGQAIVWSIKDIRSGFPAGTATPVQTAGGGPTTYRDFLLANRRMAASYKLKGYHYHFDYAQAGGHLDGGAVAQTLPAALLYVWRGYPID